MPEGQSETRLRLLETAEKLFAEHGIYGVSLRKIRVDAQILNSNAIQYHFRDRDDLVRALLAWRVAQMEAKRAEMLTLIHERGQERDLRALMEVICLPQLSVPSKEGSFPYARFSADYLTRYPPVGMAGLGEQGSAAPALRETQDLLMQALSQHNRTIALMRINSATILFLNMAAAAFGAPAGEVRAVVA